MEMFKVSFVASNQQLTATGTKHASDTYADIEATFALGERWTDMDTISAVWWNDFTRIATVLDSEGKCTVPYEVLTRKGCVRVNLVGSVVEDGELVTRLTSYSAEAVHVNEKIKLTGNEPQTITPSQFEQFVENVKADADRAESAKESAETASASAQGYAQSASASATSASESATASEQSATASARDAQTVSEIAVEVEVMKNDAELARDEILGMSAEAVTLPAGSEATASYADGLLSLGIPRGNTGATGAKGDKGDTGATPNLTIGTVETLEPTESATATITGTAENPVLNLGIPQGDTGEVSLADLSTLLPTDTASGDIASFPDGQSVIPLLSLIADIEPIQSGSGTPSPDNVRPISGWTEVAVYDDPLYGGFIEWNQLQIDGNFTNEGYEWRMPSNATGSFEDNVLTITVNNPLTANSYLSTVDRHSRITDHIYFATLDVNPSRQTRVWYNYSAVSEGARGITCNANAWTSCASITKAKNSSTYHYWYLSDPATLTTGDTVKVQNCMIVDLTRLFGETKANEIYAMEQEQTGSGVAYFKSLFPNNYYPYNTGEETNVSAVNGLPYLHYTTDLGQTVYGGELDVVSGELVIDRAMGTLDGTENWSAYASRNGFYTPLADMSQGTRQDGLTNYLVTERSGAVVPYSCWFGSNSNLFFALEVTDLISEATPTAWKAYLANNPLQVVYPLATPQTIQLTPQEVYALLGQNNVWADSGEVSVTYKADVTKWVEKKLS